MATDGPMTRYGNGIAGADLSAKQFYAVKLSAANTFNLAGNGDIVFGILQNKPTANQAVDACFSGICKAIAGGTITAGDAVEPDANGKLIIAGSGNVACGKAIDSAVSGDIFKIEFIPRAAA